MSAFSNFILKQEYGRLIPVGDKLYEINKLIKWKTFVSSWNRLYINRSDKGGRPENDVKSAFTITLA